MTKTIHLNGVSTTFADDSSSGRIADDPANVTPTRVPVVPVDPVNPVDSVVPPVNPVVPVYPVVPV